MWLFVVFTSFMCLLISAQWNLHETDRTKSLEFDCLHYYVGEVQFRGARFKYHIYQKINYCRRPTEKIDEALTDPSVEDQKFTFEQLRCLNGTVRQLLMWSAPIELVERYSLYTSQSNTSHSHASEFFLNCTQPWFGSRCQYSFDLGLAISLAEIVQITFQEKSTKNQYRPMITNLTCYQLLQCNRAAPTCLDWREVCNGRIDCIDGAEDEAHCWNLEINECADDEYRCHNGLCIPLDFLHDDRNNPDCLDRTDEKSGRNTFDSCFKDPTFRCEEHTCHPSHGVFACGDGQCELSPFYSCKNHRNKLLEDVTLAQGNLSDSCWQLMACLTLLHTTINGHSCSGLLNSSSNISSKLSTCPSRFQFPVHSVVFGHVRFFYYNNRSNISNSRVFLPDLICYDAQLCNTIPPTVSDGKLRCQTRAQIMPGSASEYATFGNSVTSYFRTCSSVYVVPSYIHSSVYCCTNTSKCISKHRLLDYVKDCPMNDDEKFNGSCALNDERRFQCNEQENRCYSPILDPGVCKQKAKQNYTKIYFHEFCNGVDNLLHENINGRTHTDETDCEPWSCSNIYTKCDGNQTCPNGEDEWNCTKSDCPQGFHPCISPINYTLACLSHEHVQNEKIDCLGASDEPHLCQVKDSETLSHYRFLCWNTTKCTAAYNLCDKEKDCHFRDDENLCRTPQPICPKTPLANRSATDETICQMFDRKLEKRLYFTLENMRAVTQKIENKSRSIANVSKLRPNDSAWSWRCNRGLYAHFRYGGTNQSHRCFCPPSYYGDSCQYQSQRVSLTLGLLTAHRYQPYSVMVRLIDENSESIAYEQFPLMGFWGCYRPFDIYLLYSTRPKDASKNYSVHIDVFEQNSLTYVASWYLDIPFPFLPVNRLVTQLQIPVQPTSVIHMCTLNCRNGGQCRQYIDLEKFFCQCPSSWSGRQCEQPVDCTACSSDSLCIGSITHRPICVCPLNRVGPRCLLTAACLPDSCMHDGTCVLIDDNTMNNSYICICSEQFYGSRCEFPKRQISITLERPETVSLILAHVITVSNESQPTSAVTIKKSIQDQHSVSFYLEDPLHIVFIQIDDQFYLADMSSSPSDTPSTPMGNILQCAFLEELLNSTLLAMPRIRLIKTYHSLCQQHNDLACFLDGYYMCLCTTERHANCFEFQRYSSLTCRHHDYCQNGGTCYQDDRTCPTTTVCICTECYFGAQCQFVAESFGVTLDDILRYEFRRFLPLSRQDLPVKMSAMITGLMFGVGFASSILSYITFRRQKVRQVGCGLYLFAASISSFLTVMVLALKFWFLVCSQLNFITNQFVLRLGCTTIEPLLKLLFYVDNWLKACVAIERSITVFRGVYFNRMRSRQIAKWIIFALPILVIASTIHEPLFRDLIEDEEGHRRNWCVVRYSAFLRKYDSFIISVHFLIPFFINLSSAVFIIVSVAHQRMHIRHQHTYREYLREQFSEHKHTLISPIILVVLSLPRLIISLLSSCIQSSRELWLYLIAYFISFTPTGLVFVVFVLPSNLYNTEFKKYFRHPSDSG